MYEKLLELRVNQFHPFRILLSDGRKFVVRDQLGFALNPNKKQMVVALPKAGFAWINLDLIDKIESLRPARRSRRLSRKAS